MRHKSAVLDEWCAKVGRDPAEIERSTGIDWGNIKGDPIEVGEAYYELGFRLFTFGLNGPAYDLAPLAPWLEWRDAKNAG
jgi:hypothetical protein